MHVRIARETVPSQAHLHTSWNELVAQIKVRLDGLDSLDAASRNSIDTKIHQCNSHFSALFRSLTLDHALCFGGVCAVCVCVFFLKFKLFI
jgi:hypothetical protein